MCVFLAEFQEVVNEYLEDDQFARCVCVCVCVFLAEFQEVVNEYLEDDQFARCVCVCVSG